MESATLPGHDVMGPARRALEAGGALVRGWLLLALLAGSVGADLANGDVALLACGSAV